ncbi:hypothetical protein LCGC14_2899110 [marine sediment metagenome]|uniref:VWFA domain-containing protein n=1 Tax=marine sediment metagenome TaxID=412755 RepID=A0A0F9A2V2_9ZZZZ
MPLVNFDTEPGLVKQPSPKAPKIKKEPKAHIGFILDESSSMVSVWQDTIDGFNYYIGELRKEVPNTNVTFATFVADKFKLRGEDKPIDEILPLNTKSYTPFGSTPLVDSVIELIISIQQRVNLNPELKPIIVIQTDGEENSSKLYDMLDLHNRIQKKRKEGWKFILLTCGFDSNRLASKMGIDPDMSIQYGKGKTREAFKLTAQITTKSAKGGEVVFSLEDKRRLK